MREIALLPAYVTTLIIFGAVILGTAVRGSTPDWSLGIASAALVLFQTLWFQGAFLIAEEARPSSSRRPTLNWLPFAPPLLFVVAVRAAAGANPVSALINAACIVVGLLLYLSLVYRAAVALVRAEGKVMEGVPFFNAASLAWLALFYLPIGVWFVRPRLERLGSPARTVEVA